MQVIVLVLNKIEELENLLSKLKKAGINGGTILESTGMVSTLTDSNENYLLGSLRLFLDATRPESKTLFFVVKDEQVELVRSTVNEVLGGINNHDTGILFGIPTSFVDGISKTSLD